ncbi:MAG: hypothetical protein ACOX6Q_02635 [Candidatus Dojkabacteria bacterium]|jgi:hypothetical protein
MSFGEFYKEPEGENEEIIGGNANLSEKKVGLQGNTDVVRSEEFEKDDLPSSENPLKRKDVEKYVGEFMNEDMAEKLSVYFSGEYGNYRQVQNLGINKNMLDYLKIGKRYRLGIDGDEHTNLYDRESGHVYADSGTLLAILYATENIRVDLQPDGTPRYFLKDKGRYLEANDFGMRHYDHEKGRMVSGDVADITPYIRAVASEVDRIATNISPLIREENDKLKKDAEEVDSSMYLEQMESIRNQAIRNVVSTHLANPKNRELILGGNLGGGFWNFIDHNGRKIAKDFGFVGSGANVFEDYANFKRNKRKLDGLIEKPQDTEGATFSYVISPSYSKPIIMSLTQKEGESYDPNNLISAAEDAVQDYLARRVIRKDLYEVMYCFDKYKTKRGLNSPYHYYDYELYDLIKKYGVSRIEDVLDSENDCTNYYRIKAFGYLEMAGFDIVNMESGELKKQIHEAQKLESAGIWEYFKDREANTIEQRRANLDETGRRRHWLEVLGTHRASELFREGKQIYWRAKRIGEKDLSISKKATLDRYVPWDRHELEDPSVSRERLDEYFEYYGNLMVGLINPHRPLSETARMRGFVDEQAIINETDTDRVVTFPVLIEALESGKDLRGVALVCQKQKYLKDLIAGNISGDLEDAVADWPEELLNAISSEELDMYYKHAYEYISSDPDGLLKYATLRANKEFKYLDEVFKEPPRSKEDLDYRICLGNQSDKTIRGHRDLYEFLGEGETIQKLLGRLDIFVGNNGKIADLGLGLDWAKDIANKSHISREELKKRLDNVRTTKEMTSFNYKFWAEQRNYS